MATLSQRLQAEIDRANAVSSKDDKTVHDAIGSLIDGYGTGGGGASLGSIEVFVTDFTAGEVSASKGVVSTFERKIIPT